MTTIVIIIKKEKYRIICANGWKIQFEPRGIQYVNAISHLLFNAICLAISMHLYFLH